MKKLIALFIIPFLLFARIVPDELIEIFHFPKDISDEKFIEEIQAQWRQTGKERWNYDLRHEELKDELKPIFVKMGYLNKINSSHSHYQYVVIHGATLHRVKTRIAHLEEEIERGLKFEKIVFLTGMRKLEDWEKIELPPSIEWEWEMVDWVRSQSELPKNIAFEVINAKAPPNQTRPSTNHTVLAWLQTNPEPGSILAFSNQPYVPYQHAFVKSLLPDTFTLETIGTSADDDWTVAIVLDTIAKTLFYEKGTKH